MLRRQTFRDCHSQSDDWQVCGIAHDAIVSGGGWQCRSGR